jgi:hypothetical protein
MLSAVLANVINISSKSLVRIITFNWYLLLAD